MSIEREPSPEEMGIKPSEAKVETQEAPRLTYQITNLEQRMVELEAQRKEVMKPQPGRGAMDFDVEKFKEVEAAIKTTQEAISTEKERMTPEDRERMERWQSEVESMKIHYNSFEGLLKRRNGMLDFNGKPRAGIDTNELSEITRELSQLQSDIRTRQGDIFKNLQEDLMKRGLLINTKAEEEWRKVRKAPL